MDGDVYCDGYPEGDIHQRMQFVSRISSDWVLKRVGSICCEGTTGVGRKLYRGFKGFRAGMIRTRLRFCDADVMRFW